MTLGEAGVAGSDQYHFKSPSAVAVAANGDIFVADGHGANENNRVVKYSKDGKFVKAWGKTGYAPGEFRTLHALAIDSRGRVFVADRGNNRIQLFDQEGKFLTIWTQFGTPSGIFFDDKDQIYVADSESDLANNPGWESLRQRIRGRTPPTGPAEIHQGQVAERLELTCRVAMDVRVELAASAARRHLAAA